MWEANRQGEQSSRPGVSHACLLTYLTQLCLHLASGLLWLWERQAPAQGAPQMQTHPACELTLSSVCETQPQSPWRPRWLPQKHRLGVEMPSTQSSNHSQAPGEVSGCSTFQNQLRSWTGARPADSFGWVHETRIQGHFWVSCYQVLLMRMITHHNL